MKAKDKIVKAKVKLQKDNPFFAYLVMNLNFKEEEEVESIGVNFKGDCGYNEKWIESVSDDKLKGVLAHEVLHLALQHLQRGQTRNHKLFNISCDLVVNNILVNNNFDLPDGLVPYNNRFQLPDKKWVENLDKKTAEQVYDELDYLIDDDKNKMDGDRFDEHRQANDDDEVVEIQGQKDKWKKAFSEASCYAKQQGNLPKGMERLLNSILNTKVNWKHLLYKYLTATLPYDYTYSRPSKKSFSTGFYMPSILRESIEVCVSVDTSGSISQEELSEFLGEIRGIARTFNNIKIRLIICDSKIHEVYEFGNNDSEDIANIKISGGGGTSHKPVYDYIAENFPNTKLLVNFTDGYTDFPDEESVKSIWVITKGGCSDDNIPFGEVINLE